MLEKQIIQIYRDQVRKKFGSVAALARLLGVTRASVYLALNNDPHMGKLRAIILELIGEK